MSGYRPQFVYPPTPEGFKDEQFSYTFDGSNVVLLGAAYALAAGAQQNNIPLPLQPDADFLCRGIKLETPGDGPSDLWVILKTPAGDYLSTVYVPASRVFNGWGQNPPIGRLFVPFEPEISCTAGGIWQLYLYNPTSGSVLPPKVTLCGVKRRDCRVPGVAA